MGHISVKYKLIDYSLTNYAWYRRKFASNYNVRNLNVNSILKYAWSPCIFSNGYRNQDNFQYSDYCVLDFDAGYTIEEALNDYCDTKHVIGITKSHNETHHKFRLIIPWEKRIEDLATYRFNIGRIIQATGSDDSCIDGARFYWPCKEIVSISTDGYSQEVNKPHKKWLEKQATPYMVPKCFVGTGVVPYRTKVILKEAFPEGERNNLCYVVAKDLLRSGYSQQETYEAILSNPAYKGGVDFALAKEIQACINSATKNLIQKERLPPSLK